MIELFQCVKERFVWDWQKYTTFDSGGNN